MINNHHREGAQLGDRSGSSTQDGGFAVRQQLAKAQQHLLVRLKVAQTLAAKRSCTDEKL